MEVHLNQYSNNIIYGDTQNFQSGILREEFKGKEIRKGRPFNCIIKLLMKLIV